MLASSLHCLLHTKLGLMPCCFPPTSEVCSNRSTSWLCSGSCEPLLTREGLQSRPGALEACVGCAPVGLCAPAVALVLAL